MGYHEHTAHTTTSHPGGTKNLEHICLDNLWNIYWIILNWICVFFFWFSNFLDISPESRWYIYIYDSERNYHHDICSSIRILRPVRRWPSTPSPGVPKILVASAVSVWRSLGWDQYCNNAILRFQITGVWVVKQIQLQFETSTRYFQRKAAKRQHVLEDIESSLDYCWTMSLWIYLGTFSDK